LLAKSAPSSADLYSAQAVGYLGIAAPAGYSLCRKLAINTFMGIMRKEWTAAVFFGRKAALPWPSVK
jgi:hypothetical protein